MPSLSFADGCRLPPQSGKPRLIALPQDQASCQKDLTNSLHTFIPNLNT